MQPCADRQAKTDGPSLAQYRRPVNTARAADDLRVTMVGIEAVSDAPAECGSCLGGRASHDSDPPIGAVERPPVTRPHQSSVGILLPQAQMLTQNLGVVPHDSLGDQT